MKAHVLAYAARLATACLLITSLAGVPPLATLRSTETARCGDMCSRCHCQGHSGSAGLRAPCPCCDPRGGGDDGMAGSAAILAATPPASRPFVTSEPIVLAGESRPCLARAVPRPPPRVSLPA